ncbi:MAG TPA: RimK family alpha-L-glutamate ligase [Gaiellaceae bacterium]|jgi:RimK family alpha-L-glutamate ligase|nr:RimK family alpha-L-glutamate ligase [Gaiellaceae bacterium]
MAVVAVVGSRASETNSDLAAAWRGLGADAAALTPHDALAVLRAGDVALGRIDVRRTLDGVEPGFLALLGLAQRGVRVLNAPAALLRTHDKLRTARALRAAGVPHPSTEHVTLRHPWPSLRPPVVVKPRFGSWGADVLRCDTDREVGETILGLTDKRWFRRQGALVQALVPPVGNDLRMLVAGGRVVGAESRVAAPEEWRTNISLGGTYQSAVVSPRARSLAIAAARAVGGDLVGIDLLPSGTDYVVLEVNGSVDFHDNYSLPGTDVYAEIARALRLPVARPALAAVS